MSSRTRNGSPIPTSPGPLFSSPSPAKSSKKKRAASPTKSKSPSARRRVTYEDGGSPGREEDDGSVRDRPSHTGGSRDRPSVDDRSDGDGRLPELSSEESELFSKLSVADDPLMQQMAVFLQGQVARNDDLQRRLKASEDRAKKDKMLRDHEEKGVSTFHHDPWQMAYVFNNMILPHIADRACRDHFSNLDWDTADPEESTLAFSLLTKLKKSTRAQIFRDHMRDSNYETLPRELSVTDLAYYNREQKAKDKTLVQQHKDFSPVLQVLHHTALDCFRTPTDGLSTEQLLAACQQSSFNLCSMLFEYYGKQIVQPRRDLFEQATKMQVSFSANTGFLTRVEAAAAMETAKQTELFQAYAETSRPTQPKNKFKGKSKGDGRRSGRPLPLQLLPNPAAAQQQPPSASPSAPPASPAARQSTLPPAGRGRGRGGRGGKGKGQ